jgi:hypothetical protein
MGVAALAICAGACAALSGLDGYHECDSCQADDGSGDARPPASQDATFIGDTGATAEDVSAPPTSVDGDDGDSGDAGGDDGDATPSPPDTGLDAPVPDAEPDAASPPDAGVGPICGPLGTSTRCTGTQVCCGDASAQVNTCAAGCAADAIIRCSVPSDCPASTPLCCGQLSLKGTYPPCAATSFSSVCAVACADKPPTSCSFTGTVRLCLHDSDCTSDSAGPLCYNFDAPISWCSTSSAGSLGSGKEQK